MLCSIWDLPGPAIKPESPALAGGFLTTGPPQGSPHISLKRNIPKSYFSMENESQSCPSRLLSTWSSPGQNTEVGSWSLLQGIFPNQGRRIKSRSPTLQEDFLPAGPPGKPKNTGVCSLSLLQQGLNGSLLHCRQILYQLSYTQMKIT